MTSSKPYVIRAIYDWIVDNNCTPHLLVDAEEEGVEVPQDYVTDGQIVLNVSPSAVVNLQLANESVRFSGRFGGVPVDIIVPVGGVIGIYARENGQGMIFDEESDLDFDPEPPGTDPTPSLSARPSLRLVK
ncbi:MAG: ClpXP protease specificity-enhancing factor [Luminiphilus sp.]|nr:ClpXP protease specificity-enhancing factor [Luminiphilus sp.]